MRYLIAFVLCVVFLSPRLTHAETETPKPEASTPSPMSEDEQAIRKVIESYVATFNAGDAEKLASHWTNEGQLITPEGKELKGRKVLAKAFANYFEVNKGVKIELLGIDLNVISPHVAIETGTAVVVVPNEEPQRTEYEAVHVKGAEGWKMDSVSEAEADVPAPTHYEQLAPLEWMVGTWGNASNDSQIETTCRWTTNKNFLVKTFRVVVADRVDFEGTQIIGWDPYAQTIRSWVFDSDGGFGVGRWRQSGDNRWTVQTIHHLPDGRRGTATNSYELVDENTVRFASTARVVDGELMPSIDPVKVARK